MTALCNYFIMEDKEAYFAKVVDCILHTYRDIRLTEENISAIKSMLPIKDKLTEENISTIQDLPINSDCTIEDHVTKQHEYVDIILDMQKMKEAYKDIVDKIKNSKHWNEEDDIRVFPYILSNSVFEQLYSHAFRKKYCSEEKLNKLYICASKPCNLKNIELYDLVRTFVLADKRRKERPKEFCLSNIYHTYGKLAFDKFIMDFKCIADNRLTDNMKEQLNDPSYLEAIYILLENLKPELKLKLKFRLLTLLNNVNNKSEENKSEVESLSKVLEECIRKLEEEKETRKASAPQSSHTTLK